MADYPERTVTAQTNMAEYERAMRVEKLRKKYGNMLWNVNALRGRGWASTSAAQKWKSSINSGGSSLTGLSTRLKMMKDADKEFVGNQLTGNFQNWLTENPDATIGSFNTWANEQGPWYEAERRARDQKVVKDRLDAMESTKVAEAVDTLFGEYNDEWITGSYAEQNQVRQNIADSDAIKNLPSKWRASAVDEVIKMLNSLLTPTGQYAADEWQMKKDKWAAAQKKTKADEDKERIARNRIDTARSGAYRLFEYMKTAEEAPGIGLGLSFNDAKDKVTEEMEDTLWDRKEFDDLVKTLRREDAPTPPGTKPVYDPATDSTIFATDAEIEADDSLVPPGQESNLEKDYAQVGRWMVRNGKLPVEVWNRYRMGGQNKLDASLDSADQELLYAWIDEVETRRAKAAAGVNINYELLNPNASGQVTGQEDGFLSNPRLKKTK
jgi:hypothetical protein